MLVSVNIKFQDRRRNLCYGQKEEICWFLVLKFCLSIIIDIADIIVIISSNFSKKLSLVHTFCLNFEDNTKDWKLSPSW